MCRSCLNRDSRSRLSISTLAESRSRQSRSSRQFEKRHLNSRDFLDSLKNDISTNLDNFYAIKSRFVSIFIFVSIETLDLDISKTDISTVEKILTLQKISLNAKDVLDLDLDWSQLSRPPWLSTTHCCVKTPKSLFCGFFVLVLS